MTNKLEAVQEKYHTAKTMTTIKNYFLKNANEEVWKELEDNINKRYLVIPNITAWYQDFVLGGGNKAQLAPLLLEPFTHTVDLEKFNAYGNVAFGDMLAMLRCCMDFNMKEIEVLDFGPTIMILAAMVTSVVSKKNKCKHREEESGMIFDISKEADWLVRSAIALFTSPSNVAHTDFTFHIPNMHNSLQYSNMILQTIRPYMKLLKADLQITPEIYQGLTIGAYFMFLSGLKLRANFEKPNLVFHEMELTHAQRALVCSDDLKSSEVIDSIRIYGLNDAYELYKGKLSKSERARIDIAFKKANRDEVALYIPNENTQYINQVINSRVRPPAGMTVIRDNPCEKGLSLEPVPIATCTIDVDKIISENSTKSEEWLLGMVSMLYSNAQDINRLRARLQSNADNKALVVYVKASDKELVSKLQGTLKRITNTLVSTYGSNMTFKIAEDN